MFIGDTYCFHECKDKGKCSYYLHHASGGAPDYSKYCEDGKVCEGVGKPVMRSKPWEI